MAKLDFFELIFLLKAIDDIELPPFPSITIRGGLGVSFKNLYCVNKKSNSSCKDCILRFKCPYSLIFDTYIDEIPQDFPFRIKTIPRPFVLYMKDSDDVIKLGNGDRFELGITLIGSACDYFPYLLYAMDNYGKNGVGLKKGKFVIDKIIDSKGNAIYEDNKLMSTDLPAQSWEPRTEDKIELNNIESLTIDFISPVRIKSGRKIRDAFSFEDIIKNLLRRISLLSYYYCKSKPDINYKALIKLSKSVEIVNKNLKWVEYQRYSGRQKTILGLGGVKGSITIEGVLQPFLPFLEIAEKIHIGKNTTFGFGKILLKRKGD